LADGSLKVFDTSTCTAGGETIEGCSIAMSHFDFSTGAPVLVYEGETVECIVDGAFEESMFRSAPYFSIIIDGITEDA
ncbi:MAG: hypothetical protein MJ099_02700, partial [Clostridia bacterium]|nr:hypothetical protein [Clostridia bacterium]